MKKNILLICFLISFHLSIQITDDELYDYAVIIVRGMANLEKRENAKCANQLVENKAKVLPAVKNIIKLVNEGASYWDLAAPLWDLRDLQSNCDLSNLLLKILALKENNEQLKSTIKQLGQKLSGKIDLSVD